MILDFVVFAMVSKLALHASWQRFLKNHEESEQRVGNESWLSVKQGMFSAVCVTPIFNHVLIHFTIVNYNMPTLLS